MEKHQNVSVHLLAKQAKNRLRTDNPTLVGQLNGTSLRDQHNRAYEEMLYQKVIAILEKEEEILNPLERLLESKDLEDCDEASRERNVLQMSRLYIKLKNRYRCEHMRKEG